MSATGGTATDAAATGAPRPTGDRRRPTVLFLQGPPSPFWYELADAFEAAGARVVRVNLSTADWVYWRRRGAINYRGRLSKWPDFLRRLVARENVTQILYFSDRFPWHRAAAEVAREAGVEALSIEFGYLRPGWITLERGGMGAWSHFPRDPAAITAVAARAGEVSTEGFKAHRRSTEVAFELFFAFINEYYFGFFPFHRRGVGIPAALEYGAGLVHVVWRRIMRSRTRAALAPFEAGERCFTLLPLQLQSDAQIRCNTSYRDQLVLLEAVIASFAAEAPADRHLLIKLHPLDPGLVAWCRRVGRMARAHGVADRVLCFDGGNLNRLIAACEGVIVSNSTVGLIALRAAKPVMVFGDAVYDIAGLVHGGDLATFWRAPDPVDPVLVDALVRALAATIQVSGSIYDVDGRATAIGEIVRRVLEGRVNGLGAFVDPPPRLAARRVSFADDTAS